MASSTTSAVGAALTAPPGSYSNLEHPPNLLWRFNVIAQTVCMTVTGILFFLRCFVRLGFSRMAKQWVLEDWMVCLSFVGLVIYSALMSIMMKNHAGVHGWNLTSEQAHHALYYFWVESIIYGPFIFFTKLSILLLYLRLLVPTRWSPLWTTIHIFISISMCFYIAITLVKIFQCSPSMRAYNKDISGRCINIPILLMISGLFNTISDALILLVPIKACWNLKMSWQKKVAVCAVFTIGAVAPVFSAIGFACRVRTASSNDTTYNNPLILLWGQATAEVTTGVICACLPCLPSLVRGHSSKVSTSTLSLSRSNLHSRPENSIHSYHQDKDIRSGAYVELQESNNGRKRMGLEIGEEAASLVTGEASLVNSLEEADKGLRKWKEERAEAGREEKRNGVIGLGQGIMRTVRIEQTGGLH